MIRGFSHIYLPVRDLDESIEFYTQKLDFYLLRKYSWNGTPSAYVGMNGILLEMSNGSNTPSVDGRSEFRVGLEVPDIEAALTEFKARGVEVAREPWQAMTFWGKQAQIKDPSGYLISIREWRDPDGPQFEGWQPESDNVVRLA